MEVACRAAMEDEDAELEEGEAKEPLDPDTDFSYLDTRLEMLLGDCQKEFQGGNLSTEKLGSKYGGYGTFLPTQARVPSLLADPHPAPPAAEVGRPVGEGVAAEPVKRSAGASVQQGSVKENGAVSTFAANKVKLKIKLGKQAADTDEAKRKALYNGLGLGLDDESDDDASLDDDDDNYSRSNVESPEPSPMSMIEMMTAPCPEGGLLSPLSDSTFEILDAKESNSYMHKPGNFSTATSNAYPSGSKVDLNSPRGPVLEYRKGKGLDTDRHTVDGKKGADFVADSNGGRKSRRDSDADKAFVKERQSKSGRNDAVRGEQHETLDEKIMEGFGKEEFDLVRDPLSKSSRKQIEINKPPAVNGQKEKEVADGKGPGKSQASKIRDSKEFSRSKAAGKAQNLKDSEVVRMADSEKESHDKGLTLSEARKQGKEDSKSMAPVRIKENSKEGFRENQKKDVAGDVKAKDLVRDVPKSGSNPSATKKTTGVGGRKGTSHEHKSSKSAQEKKPSLKELERERMSLPEPVASKEEEKVPAVVEAAPASLVVPQLVLDNWVACDKCEQWRLLMPQVNPDTLPKKWRCKMMDWLPGKNDCKFKEEETTAAVYNLLGYQNPALPAATLPAAATAAAPVALQAPAPAAEPVLDKWADEVDTKKNFLPKKGVARKLGGSVAKVAGGKGVDGAMKSKNINDMGLDNSGDGTTVSDKHKPKAKEKVKRTRPNEGEDTRIKKKVLQDQERNLEASQWRTEALDIEPIQGEKERGLLPPGETQGGGPGKRKKVGAFEDLDETPNLKKNKGGRARLQFDDSQVPSEEDYMETDKKANVQKSKRETSILKPKDVSHTGLQDKETQDINSVLKDLRENDGVSEKRREDRDQGRRSKASEKQWRSKEDASDSEQRTWKKRRDDASYDRPNQSSPREKPAYGREDFNRSTSSKVSNSSSGSLKGVGSPLESTVSSSPVRATNGNREFINRVASGHAALGTDMAMQSSPGPKHVRAASRGSSLDEGEYRHTGVTHNTTRFGKQDSSGEARDDGWYDEEDRGMDRGHSHNHHPERHPHSSGDIDDLDGQQVRRKGNRERDSDRRRLDIRDNDHVDHNAKDRNTRDDRCRPPRESGLEKPGERSWEEDVKPDGAKYAHKRDDSSAQAHGARAGPPSKETNRESDRIVSNARKDGGGVAVGPSDVNKRPGASSNTRGGSDRGEALKREDMETGLAKSFVGEVATCSPVKKDKEYAHAILTSNNFMKTAKDLKHSADRLKNADETESTNLYLQSALEFLQSAAVLESVQTESTTNKSMEVYRDTAGLCEYCGTQYKRRGDLRATALAYTCAAVARTRLMMSKKTSFANDCKEFQSAANLTSGPHMPSNGESPSSSSASDVDNLNKHHGIVPGNKASLGKAATVSPQVPSGASGVTSLNIPARLRPVATRFLRDALDMNTLLESWQRAADATAKAEASKETQGMAAVKQVGELGGFGDIDGVVRLVRVALDAIGH